MTIRDIPADFLESAIVNTIRMLKRTDAELSAMYISRKYIESQLSCLIHEYQGV